MEATSSLSTHKSGGISCLEKEVRVVTWQVILVVTRRVWLQKESLLNKSYQIQSPEISFCIYHDTLNLFYILRMETKWFLTYYDKYGLYWHRTIPKKRCTMQIAFQQLSKIQRWTTTQTTTSHLQWESELVSGLLENLKMVQLNLNSNEKFFLFRQKVVENCCWKWIIQKQTFFQTLNQRESFTVSQSFKAFDHLKIKAFVIWYSLIPGAKAFPKCWTFRPRDNMVVVFSVLGMAWRLCGLVFLYLRIPIFKIELGLPMETWSKWLWASRHCSMKKSVILFRPSS